MKAFDDVSQHELHRKLEEPEEKRKKRKSEIEETTMFNKENRKRKCLPR
jgi:hypothetical protein